MKIHKTQNKSLEELIISGINKIDIDDYIWISDYEIEQYNEIKEAIDSKKLKIIKSYTIEEFIYSIALKINEDNRIKLGTAIKSNKLSENQLDLLYNTIDKLFYVSNLIKINGIKYEDDADDEIQESSLSKIMRDIQF
jgi:hypothetical protein